MPAFSSVFYKEESWLPRYCIDIQQKTLLGLRMDHFYNNLCKHIPSAYTLTECKNRIKIKCIGTLHDIILRQKSA